MDTVDQILYLLFKMYLIWFAYELIKDGWVIWKERDKRTPEQKAAKQRQDLGY